MTINNSRYRQSRSKCCHREDVTTVQRRHACAEKNCCCLDACAARAGQFLVLVVVADLRRTAHVASRHHDHITSGNKTIYNPLGRPPLPLRCTSVTRANRTPDPLNPPQWSSDTVKWRQRVMLRGTLTLWLFYGAWTARACVSGLAGCKLWNASNLMYAKTRYTTFYTILSRLAMPLR